MSIGARRQQREEGLDHGVAPAEPVGARAFERGRADLECGLERVRVFSSDAVTVGSFRTS